jgi:serine/threonine protein kinase
MSVRKTRKQKLRAKGGAFVASGSYGCTFSKPPLKCKNETSRRNNRYISKLINARHANKELESSNIFRSIDPQEKYFLTIEKSCNLNIPNIRPENELIKCGLKPETSQLFLMRNGGKSLDRFKLTPENFSPFLKSLLNIFEGLALAHSKQIIHHDIKPANIVTMQNNSQQFYTRLIDFGLGLDLSKPPSEETIIHTSSIISQLYPYFPFEQIIMYPFTTANYIAHSPHNRDKKLDDIKEKYQEWKKNITRFFPNITALFLKNDRSIYNLPDLTQNVMSKNDEFTSYQEAYKYYFKSCDVYMLGISMDFIFKALNIKVVFDKDGYYTFIIQQPVQTLFTASSKTNASSITWYEEFKDKFLDPLLQLVQLMIQPLSSNRITINEARDIYRDTVLEHIDTILTPENIKKYLVLQ